MKLLIPVVSSLLVCAAFVGCGKKSADDVAKQVKNTANADGNKAAATASYATACSSSTIPNIDVIKFPGVITQYDLSSLEFTRKQFYFTDGNCQNMAFTVQEKGKVNILGKSNAVANAVDEDFSFEHTTVTVNSDTLLKGFNFFNICGKNDWALSVEKDVSQQAAGLKCPGKASPRASQEVVLVEGNNMFMGADSAQAVRPATVDRKTVYLKK